MRMKLAIPVISLALAALVFAQDEGKKRVEQPLKNALRRTPSAETDTVKTKVIEGELLETVKSPGPEKYDLSKTGIEWHKGIEAALNKGKPILLLQILGNYDDVYC
jgi:hypothetical protein